VRKCGHSSGAPPVMSTVAMSVAASAARQLHRLLAHHLAAVGTASTWQWRHAWLHTLPR